MFILFTLFVSLRLSAQNAPFDIRLVPVNVSGLGGLQSFAFGQYEGKWLILGGRLDGLHRRQPFAAFDVAGNNNLIIVVDPNLKKVWTANLSSLPVSVQEQLSSTNIEFHQEDDRLYLIGGYGFNSSSATRKTFDNLTAVDVPAVIDAVINGTSVKDHFRQISDPVFAVTGGHLKKIKDTYYLVGGNKFDGNYNPMGNPTFTQVYTDAIRMFNIVDDGTTLQFSNYKEIKDAANLHRRDYNAVPQILQDGKEGITAFSGVFQPSVDLPFLHSVTINETGYAVDTGFQQYYNHYHCAVLPLYDAQQNNMHSVFFGGIAQYFDSAGVLVQDNNVPFVKTIARVSRNSSGKLSEYKLPVDMPGLLGAGAEFILKEDVPCYSNDVVKMNELSNDTTLLGYIFGGINSPAPNIFSNNNSGLSSASNTVFEVYLIKNKISTGIHKLNPQSTGSLKMQISPNPSKGQIRIQFDLQKGSEVKVSLYDVNGKKIEENKLEHLQAGMQVFIQTIDQSLTGSVYYLTLETPYETATQKLVIKNE
ncbi:MAG: T9SS type A sorting domain-containing protein [Flavobacteriales bacterium]|nr:T9SS type A sorting domain-containing protein [Flavobacteriales bacterium]